jgi:hypothetical protein
MKATIEAPLWRSTQEVLDVVRSGSTMYLIGMTGWWMIDFNQCEVTRVVFSEK